MKRRAYKAGQADGYALGFIDGREVRDEIQGIREICRIVTALIIADVSADGMRKALDRTDEVLSNRFTRLDGLAMRTGKRIQDDFRSCVIGLADAIHNLIYGNESGAELRRFVMQNKNIIGRIQEIDVIFDKVEEVIRG